MRQPPSLAELAWEPQLAVIQTEPVGYLRSPLLPYDGNTSVSLTRASVQTLPLTQQAVVRYRVQPGDTIWSIARRFGVDTNTIVWANDLPKAGQLGIGQELQIPPVDGVIHRVQEGDTLASIAKQYSVSQEAVVAYLREAVDDPAFLSPGRELVIPGGRREPKARAEVINYRVQPGDTISSLSDRFGVTVDTVVWANDLRNVNSLSVGQDLEILPVDGVRHQVLGGETLGSIADRYRVGVEQITAYNNIYDPNSIPVGQQLIVPGGKMPPPPPPPAPKPAVVALPKAETPPAPPAANSGSYIWPVWGLITQWYGPYHAGLDIATDMGTPVVASRAGRVIKKESWSWSFGWHLVLDHGDGTQALYAHLSGFNVETGQQVGQGDVIGYVGSTGYSTGPHLHLEVYQGGATVNPWNLLPH